MPDTASPRQPIRLDVAKNERSTGQDHQYSRTTPPTGAGEGHRWIASSWRRPTIGGLRGQQVDVRVSPKWKGTCALNPDEPPTTDYLDDRNRVIVLDKPVTGMIGISIGSARSSAFESFLAAATPIVESFQFDFGTGPTPRP